MVIYPFQRTIENYNLLSAAILHQLLCVFSLFFPGDKGLKIILFQLTAIERLGPAERSSLIRKAWMKILLNSSESDFNQSREYFSFCKGIDMYLTAEIPSFKAVCNFLYFWCVFSRYFFRPLRRLQNIYYQKSTMLAE